MVSRTVNQCFSHDGSQPIFVNWVSALGRVAFLLNRFFFNARIFYTFPKEVIFIYVAVHTIHCNNFNYSFFRLRKWAGIFISVEQMQVLSNTFGSQLHTKKKKNPLWTPPGRNCWYEHSIFLLRRFHKPLCQVTLVTHPDGFLLAINTAYPPMLIMKPAAHCVWKEPLALR